MNPEDNKTPAAPESQPSTPATPPVALPAAPPSDPTTPMPTPAVTGGNKSKTGLIVGIVVAVLVVAAAAAYGVYAYISNTPQNLMTAALGNLTSQKAFAGTLGINSGAGSSATNMSGDFAFEADPSNNQNVQGTIGINGSTIKLLQVNGTLYLQGNNLDKLAANTSDPSVAEVAPLLKNLNGQWFSLTQDDLKNLAASTGATGSSGASVTSAPSADDLNKLGQIYQQHPFLTADKTYNDEVVAGSNSAHFSLKLDRNQYKAFLQALKDANIKSIQVTDQDIANASSEPETPTDGAVEVWIARDSKKFTQMRVINTKKGDESTVTLTVKSQLPSFDKFEAPAGAKPFSELFTTLLGSSFSSSELTPADQSLLSQ